MTDSLIQRIEAGEVQLIKLSTLIRVSKFTDDKGLLLSASWNAAKADVQVQDTITNLGIPSPRLYNDLHLVMNNSRSPYPVIRTRVFLLIKMYRWLNNSPQLEDFMDELHSMIN